MQIQPPLSAAGAASIAAQASGKDAAAPTSSTAAATNSNISVEQSGQANSDRDAQGQGDGLADRGGEEKKKSEAKHAANTPSYRPVPTLPGQPPKRLDLMG